LQRSLILENKFYLGQFFGSEVAVEAKEVLDSMYREAVEFTSPCLGETKKVFRPRDAGQGQGGGGLWKNAKYGMEVEAETLVVGIVKRFCSPVERGSGRGIAEDISADLENLLPELAVLRRVGED